MYNSVVQVVLERPQWMSSQSSSAGFDPFFHFRSLLSLFSLSFTRFWRWNPGLLVFESEESVKITQLERYKWASPKLVHKWTLERTWQKWQKVKKATNVTTHIFEWVRESECKKWVKVNTSECKRWMKQRQANKNE